MIVVDTSIISSLAKIDRLSLLKEFTGIWITSGVVEEAIESENSSIINPLSKALNEWIHIETVDDIKYIKKIQNNLSSLSYVDSSLIVLCQGNEAILLTDDQRMITVAEEEFGIETHDLFETLITLRKKLKITKKEIKHIILDLKKKDRYEFSENDLEHLLKPRK